jgi:hypothetical protein
MGASPPESSRGRIDTGAGAGQGGGGREGDGAGTAGRRFGRQTTPQRSARTAAAAKQPQATIPATPPKIAAATERPG